MDPLRSKLSAPTVEPTNPKTPRVGGFVAFRNLTVRSSIGLNGNRVIRIKRYRIDSEMGFRITFFGFWIRELSDNVIIDPHSVNALYVRFT